MDVGDPKQATRLRKAMKWSRQQLDPFRTARVSAFKQYVGFNYSANGSSDKVPVNHLWQGVSTWRRHLVAQNPHVLVSTREAALKPSAAKFELAMNQVLHDADFERTLNVAALDALFAVGIFKVGITPKDAVDIDGIQHVVGMPYCDAIDLDDWVHDMTARSPADMEFCGNRYRVRLDYVRDAGIFDEAAVDRLAAQVKSYDEDGNKRLKNLGQGDDDWNPENEPTDHVELWDVWLPHEKQVVTFAEDGDTPLRVVGWKGPRDGPFRMLSLGDVPANTMPLTPVMQWRDMHDLLNRVFRKLGRQAERQKTITAARAGNETDASRIQSASDGDMIAVDDPSGVREMRYGGADQIGLAFYLQGKGSMSQLMGGLEVLSGTSPMTDTVGQEAMLQKAANKTLEELQDRVVACTRELVKDIGWYVWNDPLTSYALTLRIPNSDLEIPVEFTPEDRSANFYDYVLDIEPYSLQASSPGQRLQALVQTFQTFIVPLAAQLQAQGMAVDLEQVLRLIAQYGNMPDLERILRFERPPDRFGEGGQRAQPAIQAPQNTNRTYTRVNRPGATAPGQENTLAQILAGGNPQPKERAQLERAVA